MMDELRELIRNKYESQILLNEMEIRFLQHQMNPHFLFNVLLTIQIKAKRSGNETIYKMVSKLSALLRASIYTNNVDRITVGEELEYTEFYLYLQKMRFEGRFFYDTQSHCGVVCNRRRRKIDGGSRTGLCLCPTKRKNASAGLEPALRRSGRMVGNRGNRIQFERKK